MTGDCPVCGAYMIFPVGRERCDRCEIVRLREAQGEMRLVLESQDLRLKEFHDDNERLREAIKEAVAIIKSAARTGEYNNDDLEDLRRLAREGK